MFPHTQANTPIPSHTYVKTPFDENYDAYKYASRSTNPFEQNVPPAQPVDRFVMHRVRDGDSLVSLSLTYGVAVPLIKKANGITSDDIYYMTEVKIPNPKNVIYPEAPDAERDLKQTQATVRQAFKNRTGEHDPVIVERYLQACAYNFYDAVEKFEKEKYEISKRKQAIANLKVKLKKDDRDDKLAASYLESNNWDINKAYEAYKEDLVFERDQVKGGQMMPNQYQQVPQHGGFVPPGHFSNSYGLPQQGSYPGQPIQGQEYDNRFVYRGGN